ncbi:MAG: GGDEF domain-containing protein [Planctomycetota bacterium]
MDVCRYIQKTHPEVFQRILSESNQFAMAVTDTDGKIEKCNKVFEEIAGAGEAEGAAVEDLLRTRSGEPLRYPPDGGSWNVRVVFTGDSELGEEYLLHILNAGNEYIMWCSAVKAENDAKVTRMAEINEELTDLMRKLRKKNRALEKARDTIQHLATTDVLTGLPNRRRFQGEIERRLSEARRHDCALCLAMADLDNFKAVNDNFGHEAGDEVLKMFATLLQDSSREEDMVCRWGGEEFLLLLPHTNAEEARPMMERIRGSMEKKHCPQVDGPVTVSIGIAQFMKDETHDDLVAAADKAMYRAKREGRNCVVVVER